MKGCKKYCVTPSWGFQVVFYVLKQIKNNMAWQMICLDNVFFMAF